LLTPFILQQLGKSTYGLWALVGSVVGYGSLLDLGIGSAITKYVAEYRAQKQTDETRSLIATAICFYSVLGLVAFALSAVIAPIFPQIFNVPTSERTTATWLVLLMGLGIGISIPCAAPIAVLWGLQRFDIANLISVVSTFLSAAATVVVLLVGGGILGMVAVNIVVMVLGRVLTIWFIRRIAPELQFGWRGARRHLVRTVISFSSSMFVMNVAGRVQTKTDEIVIAGFLPVSAVTPYAIVRRLSELPQILTDQFMRVLLPLTSELHAEKDQFRIRALYITSTRLTLAILLPIGCTLVVLARSILTMWVGAAYADYAHLVAILTVATVVDTSQWPAGNILQGMARHRPLAIMSVGAALSNLALSILLVPSFGLTGVALGTLLPTLVLCIGFVLPYAMRTLGVSITELLKEICLPSLLPLVPMALVLFILRHAVAPESLFSIVAVVAIGLPVYAAAYAIVGASEVERETFRSLVISTARFAKSSLRFS
jgi:O-antigen/teichoic acid export membrane protein